MKEMIDRLLEDISTADFFQYQLRCSECGTAKPGKAVRFSKAGITPETPGKQLIYQTIYQQEQAHCRAESIREIAEHMNFCPICKRVVCDHCFMICEDLDMCKHCSTQLEEQGSPVLSDDTQPPAAAM